MRMVNAPNNVFIHGDEMLMWSYFHFYQILNISFNIISNHSNNSEILITHGIPNDVYHLSCNRQVYNEVF